MLSPSKSVSYNSLTKASEDNYSEDFDEDAKNSTQRKLNDENEKNSNRSRSISTISRCSSSRNSSKISRDSLASEKESNPEKSLSATPLSSPKRSDLSHNSTQDRIAEMLHRLQSDEPAAPPTDSGNSAGLQTSHQNPVAATAALPSPSVDDNARVVVRATSTDEGMPTTKEELIDLLRRNDELRLQLFEVERSERYPNRARQMNTTRSSSRSPGRGSRRQKKTIETIQNSLRREFKRQELKQERANLISQRNTLQRKIAHNKRLHRFETLTEACRGEITALSEEKRNLSLEIRHNEKTLIIYEENEDTAQATKRMAEEIKADTFLTQRSLDRTRGETLETSKMRHAKEQRVGALEEQLARCESAQAANIRGDGGPLNHQHILLSQKLQRCRRRLRALKAGEADPAAEDEAMRGDECAFLTRRIPHLREAVAQQLSSSAARQSEAERRRSSETRGKPPRASSGTPAGSTATRPAHSGETHKRSSDAFAMDAAKEALERAREEREVEKKEEKEASGVQSPSKASSQHEWEELSLPDETEKPKETHDAVPDTAVAHKEEHTRHDSAHSSKHEEERSASNAERKSSVPAWMDDDEDEDEDVEKGDVGAGDASDVELPEPAPPAPESNNDAQEELAEDDIIDEMKEVDAAASDASSQAEGDENQETQETKGEGEEEEEEEKEEEENNNDEAEQDYEQDYEHELDDQQEEESPNENDEETEYPPEPEQTEEAPDEAKKDDEGPSWLMFE